MDLVPNILWKLNALTDTEALQGLAHLSPCNSVICFCCPCWVASGSHLWSFNEVLLHDWCMFSCWNILRDISCNLLCSFYNAVSVPGIQWWKMLIWLAGMLCNHSACQSARMLSCAYGVKSSKAFVQSWWALIWKISSLIGSFCISLRMACMMS